MVGQGEGRRHQFPVSLARSSGIKRCSTRQTAVSTAGATATTVRGKSFSRNHFLDCNDLDAASVRVIHAARQRLNGTQIEADLARVGIERSTRCISWALRRRCMKDVLTNPKVKGHGYLLGTSRA
jgi:hypothetical protein